MRNGRGRGRVGRYQEKRLSTLGLVLSMLLMLTIVLLMLLALGIVSLPVASHDEPPFKDPIKFKRMSLDFEEDSEYSIRTRKQEGGGDFTRKQEGHEDGGDSTRKQEDNGEDGLQKREDQWIEVISWEPRAFVYHNFLSEEECEYLIKLAKPHMAKSNVIDVKTGKGTESRVRTSSGMFLERGGDSVIQDIEKRIADFTFIPADHGEGLQVLHYEVGQKYEPHYDYFLDEYNSRNGGQRIATVLMYLSDVEEGGETVFPAAKGNFSSTTGWNERSECAKEGISVKPKMGDALLFWSMRPDATLDPSSLHGGCPVIKGNKWSSTKWMHVGEYVV